MDKTVHLTSISDLNEWIINRFYKWMEKNKQTVRESIKSQWIEIW